MISTSLDLLALIRDALIAGQTDAADRVFTPGDWPTQPDQYPITKLRLVNENRQSIARSCAPEFTTTTLIRVISEVSAPAKLDDAGATDAELACWRIKRQNEVAIVNGYPLTARIQQIASIYSQLAFSSEGATHLAGVQMDLSIEFYEGPESFAPVEADPLVDLHLTDPRHTPHGFDLTFSQ